MKFALFYEIPVARPWDAGREHRAYKNTLEQAIVRGAVRLGRVLDRRAPLPRGVLALLEPRGAVRRDRGAHEPHAARLRRAAHAEALQPSGAHGRVGRGARPALATAASTSAPAARRRGPSSRASASTRTRRARCGRRRSSTSSAAGRTTRYAFEGKHWSLPERRVLPKPLQQPHPPIWGATSTRRRSRADRRARARTVLVRGRRAARRGEEEDRHLPRGSRAAVRSRSASASTTRPPRSRWRCARRRAKRRGTRRANRSSGTRRWARA